MLSHMILWNAWGVRYGWNEGGRRLQRELAEAAEAKTMQHRVVEQRARETRKAVQRPTPTLVR